MFTTMGTLEMSTDEIIKHLKQQGYILSDGRCSPRAKRKLVSDPELLNTISILIPYLDMNKTTFAEIKHCLINNIQQQPLCVICKTPITFEKSNAYYPATCSIKCNANYVNKPRFINNNPAKNNILLKKRSATRLQNYLLKHPELNDKDWLILHHTQYHYSMVELASILKVAPASVKNALSNFNIKSPSQKILREASNKRKYGVKNVNELLHIRTKALTTLTKKRQTDGYIPSIGEKEVSVFIKNILLNITVNNTYSIIPPYELDIYIPEHNLAIEYCGLYWHSERQGKTKNYHKNKHDLCKEKGIQLLTIFEDEWLYKQEQVKNKLKKLLNVYNTYDTIYARKCKIIRVPHNIKKDFFDINHIQGSGPGSINIGLEYEGTLVACVSFIKQKEQHYLNRYATLCNVPGGFSKLLKYFQNNYEWNRLISFADLRWSNGNLYEKTGWKLDSILPPDYSYIKNNKRIHKFNYRRKNLPKLLKHFDPDLSERENCDNNGILRIWDCGKLRYILNK